jgi:hypothetical protein
LLQEEIRRKSKGRDIEDKPQALYSNKKPFKGNLKFPKRKFETTNKSLHLKRKGNCFHCGKANHHIKDCRIRLQEEKAKYGHQANSVLNTKLFAVAFAVEDTSSDKWYLDSGATQHMTPHFEWFVSYTKNLTRDKVYLGDNSSHDIEGQGVVMITLDSGEARIIENVLHIPALKKSLISVSKVTVRATE